MTSTRMLAVLLLNTSTPYSKCNGLRAYAKKLSKEKPYERRCLTLY